jgi:spore germination protein
MSVWQRLGERVMVITARGIIAILAATGLARPAAAAPLALAYYEDSSSNASLVAEAGTLAIVAADRFSINAQGKLTGALPANVRTIVAAHHIALLATVSNYAVHGFSASIAKAILAPGTAQTSAIAAITALAAQDYAGINLDFEAVPHGLRPQYTAFAQALAASLHKQGSVLMLSVPAKTVDNPKDSWTGAYDYPVLATYVDTLQVMTYDENGPWGAPGPVAGLDWVTACLTYSLTTAPPSQISLGMPAYGYDWNLTKATGTSVAYNAIPALISQTGAVPQWNATYGSPWFTYTAANGASHVVWYENAQSVQLKSALAAAKAVASVSVWALGLDSTDFWNAVTAGFATN